jgi:2'-5' RNA ligase
MRPNWFIAFPVPGEFILGLPPVPKNFRRFAVEDVHLTLAFLGSCSPEAAHAAWQALLVGLEESRYQPFDITLDTVVPMGAPKQYTALSALLGVGRESVSACIGSLRDSLADAAHVARDKRPPKPHITLARPMRRADAGDRQAGLDWAARLDLSAVALQLDRVALYTWPELRGQRLFKIAAERSL